MSLHHLLDSGQPISPPPDIQRTTLRIDALGRYMCSTWNEATANSLRADTDERPHLAGTTRSQSCRTTDIRCECQIS